MKHLLILFFLATWGSLAQAQFTDTATLNQYLRDTIRDRRPEKVTAAQIQKGMLGMSNIMSNSNFLNTPARNATGVGVEHNNLGNTMMIDSISTLALNLTGSGGEISSFLTFNEDGIYNNSNNFFYVLGESMSVNNSYGYNLGVTDGASLHLSNILIVSDINVLSFSLNSGAGFSMNNDVFSASGVNIVNFTGDNQQLTLVDHAGYFYHNNLPNSMLDLKAGGVYINNGSTEGNLGFLAIMGDSTVISNGGTYIRVTEDGIALRDSTLLDGDAQGKMLTTDESGKLTLVSPSGGYRIGNGLKVVDNDSIYFGGTAYHNISLVRADTNELGYDQWYGYLEMNNYNNSFGYQNSSVSMSASQVAINGPAVQQTTIAGRVIVNVNGVHIGHSDAYYDQQDDISFTTGGDMQFLRSHLQDGESQNMFLTTDASGLVRLANPGVSSLYSVYNSGSTASSVKTGTDALPYIALQNVSWNGETDVEVSSIKAGDGYIHLYTEDMGEYGIAKLDLESMFYKLSSEYWLADTPLDTTFTSITGNNGLTLESHVDQVHQHMVQIQPDNITLSQAIFNEFGEPTPVNQAILNDQGFKVILNHETSTFLRVTGTSWVDYMLLGQEGMFVNVPLAVDLGAKFNGEIVVRSRTTTGTSTIIIDSDYLVAVDGDAPSAVTITFPDPTEQAPGRILKVCNFSAYNAPVDATPGLVLTNDGTPLTELMARGLYEFAVLDGVWRVIGGAGM